MLFCNYYDFSSSKVEELDVRYKFQTEHEEFHVRFLTPSYAVDPWECVLVNVTNKSPVSRNVIKIFSTVFYIMETFLKEYNPDRLRITIQAFPEESKYRLYKRFFERINLPSHTKDFKHIAYFGEHYVDIKPKASKIFCPLGFEVKQINGNTTNESDRKDARCGLLFQDITDYFKKQIKPKRIGTFKNFESFFQSTNYGTT